MRDDRERLLDMLEAIQKIEQYNEEYAKEGAQKVTEKDLEKVVNKSEEIRRKFSAKGPLARFIKEDQLLMAIVKEYRSGTYRQIPFEVVASFVFTLIYFLNPFDLVPDMLPVIDQVDDAVVMGACLMLVEQDLQSIWLGNRFKPDKQWLLN